MWEIVNLVAHLCCAFFRRVGFRVNELGYLEGVKCSNLNSKDLHSTAHARLSLGSSSLVALEL